MVEKETWGIIGGGMLGMFLSLRLAQKGYRVTLFESEPFLGGLASAWDLGDVTWDRYYHVILLSDRYFLGILEELGLDSEVNWVNTRTGFYTDGQLHSMSNAVEFLRFPPLGLWSKLRLGLFIFYASKIKNWKKFESISVSIWLKRWSGKKTYEKIWDPILRTKLGDDQKQVSAAFIGAIISRMYAARRKGLKKDMYGYVTGGFAWVLKRFAQVLIEKGVAIHMSHTVSNVERIDSNQIKATFNNGKEEMFDKIILTVPSPISARICQGLAVNERSRLNNTQYVGLVCASFLLKKPLSNFYITYIADSSVPFTSVVEMTALVDRHYFGGNSLVYLPKYVPADDPVFSLSDKEVEEKFFEALLRLFPHLQQDDIVASRIARDPYVFVPTGLNHSDGLQPIKTSIPGVHIVNSAQIVNGTMNIDESFRLVSSAMSEILF